MKSACPHCANGLAEVRFAYLFVCVACAGFAAHFGHLPPRKHCRCKRTNATTWGTHAPLV